MAPLPDEDCDPALEAMAMADPELDPVWGLLMGDGCDKEKDSDVHTLLVKNFTDLNPTWGAVEEPAPETTPEPLPPALSSTAPAAAASKPISAVVDKAEVDWECFKLPVIAEEDRPAVVRHNIEGCDAFYLDNVLLPEECAALIEQGGEHWSFWDNSETPRVTFRNAFTIEVNHQSIADLVWNRVADLVPPSVTIEDDETNPRYEVDIAGTWVPYGINPRLLLGRYLEGGHFSPHTDGTTVVDFNRRTFYTCVLFLNESPWGGHTRLYADEQMSRQLVPDEHGRLTGDPALVLAAVPPKTGRMLCFYHRLMHEGVPAAEKYIIRTDVLYRRTPELCTLPEDVEAFAMYQEAQLKAEKGECEAAAALFRRAFKHSDVLRKVYRS